MLHNFMSIAAVTRFYVFHRFLFLVLLFPLFVQASPNQLKNHVSPYLAMHGDDPVDWQQWGKPVLKKAQKQNKLILISSGYFSCHWCHVMQRESYQNKELAAFLNEHFIAVKIDRELQPALDAHLIDFVEKTNGTAGWPLNVFLTPEGYPVLGFVYAPPDKFGQLLQRVATTWQNKNEQVRQLAKNAAEQLSQLNSKPERAAQITLKAGDLQQAFIDQSLKLGDDLLGGFGNQNKFPMAPQLLALLEIIKQKPDDSLNEFLQTTLDQMQQRGLRDHIHGGFFRYTVDPDWSTPHFEKMLYTQALLAQIYLKAAEVLKRPDYVEVARNTLDFVLNEMPGRQSMFISSFSAIDKNNLEGGIYLWSVSDLKKLLSDDELAVVQAFWNLSPEFTLENGILPTTGLSVEKIAGQMKTTTEQVNILLESGRKKMTRAHAQQDMPADHKELAAWNGLLLSAFSQAALTLGEQSYEKAATKLKKAVLKNLWQDNVLWRAAHKTKPVGNAGLEDYAYLAMGLRDYARMASSEEDWQKSNLVLAKAWLLFHDNSGWYAGNEKLLPALSGVSLQMDGPMPAADAVVLRLSLDSGNPLLEKKALNALQQASSFVSVAPFSYASYVSLFSLHQSQD